MPGLGTDGYENKQGDCEQCKAAHGMTPVMDDTETVRWEFLKTFILKKKKHSMSQNSMAYGKDNSQKRKKNSAPSAPSFAVSSRTEVPDERPCSSGWKRVGSSPQPPLSGLKARAKCLIRNCMNLNHFPSKIFFFPYFQPKNRMSSPKTTQVTDPQ